MKAGFYPEGVEVSFHKGQLGFLTQSNTKSYYAHTILMLKSAKEKSMSESEQSV